MIKPNKQLGQNFLKNETIAQKIIDAAKINPSDIIIEIGPGTGILTEKLIKTRAKILAVEKDYDLITKLQKIYKNTKTIKLIHQDILWFKIDELENYKVIGNIPYNITSPIIRKFLENDNKPSAMILMVQKEVAERIVAKPGNSQRGLLTLIVEYFAEAEILFEVSRDNFYPAPTVDSAVIKLQVARSKESGVDNRQFLKIVKAGFSQKRKKIHNSLGATFHWTREQTIDTLKRANIDADLRAEDLKLSDWLKLYDIIAEK